MTNLRHEREEQGVPDFRHLLCPGETLSTAPKHDPEDPRDVYDYEFYPIDVDPEAGKSSFLLVIEPGGAVEPTILQGAKELRLSVLKGKGKIFVVYPDSTEALVYQVKPTHDFS